MSGWNRATAARVPMVWWNCFRLARNAAPELRKARACCQPTLQAYVSTDESFPEKIRVTLCRKTRGRAYRNIYSISCQASQMRLEGRSKTPFVCQRLWQNWWDLRPLVYQCIVIVDHYAYTHHTTPCTLSIVTNHGSLEGLASCRSTVEDEGQVKAVVRIYVEESCWLKRAWGGFCGQSKGRGHQDRRRGRANWARGSRRAFESRESGC